MMMNDDSGALRTLLDREEIRELGLKYCHYMWTKDVRLDMCTNAFEGTAYPHPYALIM